MSGPRRTGPSGSAGADDDIPRFLADLGLPGHRRRPRALPARADAATRSGRTSTRRRRTTARAWPIHYRTTEAERLATLEQARCAGVRAAGLPAQARHGPLAHRVGHGVRRRHARAPCPRPRCSRSRTSPSYLGAAVEAGARVVKVHVQVGGFDPRDPLLRPAWGLLAEAGVPAIVHCGHGPIRGAHTGLDVFAEVLAEHPRLPVVLAHAGMPDFGGALDLVAPVRRASTSTRRWSAPRSACRIAPLPADWPARLADVADRVVLRLRLPQHPLRLRRAGGGGRGVGGRRRPARRRVPALGAARHPRPLAVSAPIARDSAVSRRRPHPRSHADPHQRPRHHPGDLGASRRRGVPVRRPDGAGPRRRSSGWCA